MWIRSIRRCFGNKCKKIKDIKKYDLIITSYDLLKRDLEQAIKEERYEDAAKIRDEIKALEKTDNKNKKDDKSE